MGHSVGERQTSVMPVSVNMKCTLMSKIHTYIYIYIYPCIVTPALCILSALKKINKVDLKKR